MKLLEHFDRVSEAPGAVPRLRRFILDLAVRGKLLEQDLAEEAAAVLYERLRAGLGKDQRHKPARGRRPVSSRSAPFFDNGTFPGSWFITTFDSVNRIVSGVAKGKHLRGFRTAIYPYLRVANVQRGYLDLGVVKYLEIAAEDIDRYRLEVGDVLMTEGGDWDKLGRAAVWNGEIPECIHQNHIYRIRSVDREHLLPAWIAMFANSALGRSYFEGASKQTTNLASINMTQLRSCPLPLPPAGEQRRIVAKVDELMALCDRLEAAQSERERRRVRAVASSLKRLNQSADSGAFREWVGLYLDQLSRLAIDRGKLKKLRETILILAVRGLLVSQDAKDEPAVDDRPLAGDETPFKVPLSWCWARLRSLGQLRGGGAPLPRVAKSFGTVRSRGCRRKT